MFSLDFQRDNSKQRRLDFPLPRQYVARGSKGLGRKVQDFSRATPQEACP
jgi:hypothetical protein